LNTAITISGCEQTTPVKTEDIIGYLSVPHLSLLTHYTLRNS